MPQNMVAADLPTYALCSLRSDRRHAATHFVKEIVGKRAGGMACCGIVLTMWMLIPVLLVLKLEGMVLESLS